VLLSIRMQVRARTTLLSFPDLHIQPDGTYAINYQRALTMPRYLPPGRPEMQLEGQTITRDDVSSLLSTNGHMGDSELSKRMWDKMLLENSDDVVHVLSLKGLFLYLSPSCKRVLEYEPNELVGTALSSVCHPSDIVPVTRELKDTSTGVSVNVVFRIRRKHSGYMWFEGHGSLHTEQGKGRKCIILVGRERRVYTLDKNDLVECGGIGDNELWTKLSTSGMVLFVSSNVRQLLDRQPEEMVGTSIQALMRHDSKAEFGRILGLAQTGKKASVKHDMMNKRGQTIQAFSTIFPGDAIEGQKPTFVIGQTRLLKFSRGSNQSAQRQLQAGGRSEHGATPLSNVGSHGSNVSNARASSHTGSRSVISASQFISTDGSATTYAGQNGLPLGQQDDSLASEENLFEELKTTRSTSWQFELRQMEKRNRFLAEEVQSLLAAKKKRKRRKGAGQLQKDCANCHTRVTPEWRRGPSGNRDLCNSCGLRWAKQVRHASSERNYPPLTGFLQNGRVSPRTSSQHSTSDKGSKASASPRHSMAAGGKITETSEQALNHDKKAANAVRADIASQAMHTSGVPPKIDEGIEPD
jgi:PAS domain S-box-containing protein